MKTYIINKFLLENIYSTLNLIKNPAANLQHLRISIDDLKKLNMPETCQK